MSVSRITTHVLDTTRGRPAAGVAVRLHAEEAGGGWREIAAAVTNADGRIPNLGPADLPVGNYRIEVDTAAYYLANNVECFFSSISLSFSVRDPAEHYHVPLLISPFAISTYRGS